MRSRRDQLEDFLARLPQQERQVIEARAAELIEGCRRRELLEEFNVACGALKDDSEAWAEELVERAIWEGTLLDDLEDDEPAS